MPHDAFRSGGRTRTTPNRRGRRSVVKAARQGAPNAQLIEMLEGRRLLAFGPAGPEFLVNSYTTNDQVTPAIAVNADGDFVVAWESSIQDGSGPGIYAQRYDADGVAQGAEFRVNSYTTGAQRRPAIAIDQDGDFVVTWESINQDGDGYGVYAQRYNSSGSTQGAAFRVNTYTTAQQAQSAVAMTPLGDFVVVWRSSNQDGSSGGLYGQRYDSSGSAQGTEFLVNAYTTSDQTLPTIGISNSGDFVVGWISIGQIPGDANVYARRFSASGMPQGSEVQVNTHTTGFQSGSFAAVDQNGDFVVVWHSPGQDGSDHGVFGQRLDSSGTAVGSEFQVNTFTTGFQVNPSVVMGGAGDFVVSWESSSQDGSGYGVYAQRYDPAGVPQGVEFRVNTHTTGDQRNPAVQMDGEGQVVVAWASTGQDGSSGGVYAQRYGNGAGQHHWLLGGETQVNTYTLFQQFLPSIGMNDTGDYVIAWTGSGTGDSGGIFARRYNAAGVAQGSEFSVNTFTTGGQSWVSAAMDDAGNFVIAWESAGQDGSGDGIYARRYTAAGTAVGTEFRVNTYTTGAQIIPAAAMDDTGDFVITWSSYLQDASGYGVYAQRYNASGVAQGLEFQVNTYTTSSQALSSVAMNDAGDFVVTWQSQVQDGNGSGVYAKRYNALGVVQGSEFRVNTYTTSNQQRPSIALDGSGDFVVVWASRSQDGSDYGIYAQRYNATGVAQGSEFLVNTYTTGYQSLPKVAMDAAGDFVISWAGYGLPIGGVRAYARRFNASGVAQGSEFRVNTFTGPWQDVPAVAMSEFGDFVVAWASGEQDGDGSGIYSQRYVTFFTTDAATLGDRVWYDTNGNGIQDGGEPGLFGAVIELSTTGGTPVATAMSDAAGLYSLPALAGASAQLRFAATGFIPAPQDQGGDDALDSDADPVTGLTSSFTVGAPGSTTTTFDAGFYSAAGPYHWPLGGELQVNAHTTASQQNSAVASNAAGDFVVVWQSDGQDGDFHGVYARRYSAAGTPLGTEFRVNTYTTGAQNLPSVAMDPRGNFIIAWHSNNQDNSLGGIYAQRYDSKGIAVGAEFRANSYTTGGQLFPSVATDVDGDFVIAWSGAGPGDTVGIFARRYNASGVAQGTEFLVNTYTTNFQQSPVLAMSFSGNFVVAWSGDGAADASGVYARRYDSAGVAQGTEFLVNTYTTNDQGFVAAAMDQDGDFVLAWDSSGGQDGSDYGTFARRYNSAGTPQGSEFLVNTYTTGLQGTPAVAMSPAGDFVIAWEANNQDGDDFGVFARRYDAAGLAQGPEFRINTNTPSHQSGPGVAMDAAGDFVATWTSDGQDGDSNGVYAQPCTTFGPEDAATIGDRVWFDADGDGIQDGGESGIAGATVELYSALGAQVAVTTTDGSGNYSFPALAGSSVYLRFISPAGRSLTLQDQGGDDESDSDIPRISGQTPVFSTGISGSIDNSIDAGFRLIPLYHWPLGAEVQVNTYVTATQVAPSIARNAAGDYVVVWESFGQDGSLTSVHAQRYNAAGVAQGAEFRVNSYTTGFQDRSTVAMDSAGNFVVAWTSFDQDGSGDGIYAQRYNAAGIAQGAEFRVNTYTTGFQVFPSAAMDSDGDFVITWAGDGVGDTAGVFAQRYNAAGMPQGTEFRVNTYTTSFQHSPSAAMNAAGDFVVSWTSYLQDANTVYGVYAQRYNAAGVAQGTEFRVNTYTTGGQSSSSAAMDTNGNIVIVWQGAGVGDTLGGVFAQRFDSTGSAQGSEFRVNTYTTGVQYEADVAMGAYGDFIVAWTSSYQDGDTPGIYAQRYDASGVASGPEFRANTYTSVQSHPAVGMNASGDSFVIVRMGQDGDNSSGIISQRYTTFGPAEAATIGDRIWNDANANGIQNGGEVGIAGVAVELYNSNGAFVAGTTTNGAGLYSFVALGGAAAYLKFGIPVGLAPTLRDQGGSDFADSDIDIAGKTSTFVVAPPTTNDPSIDAGFGLPATATGVVYHDRSGDGIKNGGDEGVWGFTVFQDLDSDGELDPGEPFVISGPTGSFTIPNVVPGTYRFLAVGQEQWTEPLQPAFNVPSVGTLTPVNLPVRTTAPDTVSQPQGPEFAVNPGGSQPNAPAMAMDADGDFVVVWHAYDPFLKIFGRRYDATGAAEGPVFVVNSLTTGASYLPSVAMDADGNFVVVWNGGVSVYARQYDSTGAALGTEFSVHTSTSSVGDPAVAMEPDGDFVIAWPSVGEILARRYSNNGTPQGSEFQVNTYTTGDQYEPSVAVDSTGDSVVTWTSVGQDGSVAGVYARRFDSASLPQGTEFRVNTTTIGSQSLSSVDMDSAGNFVVAWQNHSPYQIYAQRFNASGIPQGVEFRVNTITTATEYSPTVAMDSDGDFVVAWYHYPSNWEIHARSYNAAGLPQGSEFVVNSILIPPPLFGPAMPVPALAMDNSGDFAVAWPWYDTDYTLPEDPPEPEQIYIRLFTVEERPAITSSPFVWNSGPQRIEFVFDQDVLASMSSADLLLENLTTATTIPTGDILMSFTDPMHFSFSFPTLPNGGSLPDGNYRATIIAAGVNNASGTKIAVNYAVEFFVLAADANRDRRVDVGDLAIFGSNWMGTDKTFSEGDFNYDGVVNKLDLNLMALRWHVKLDAPPLPAAPAPTVAQRPSRTPTRTPTRVASDILQ